MLVDTINKVKNVSIGYVGTITLNGVDKWAYLDGSLFGKLHGTYQTGIKANLYDAISQLLTFSKRILKVNRKFIKNFF